VAQTSVCVSIKCKLTPSLHRLKSVLLLFSDACPTCHSRLFKHHLSTLRQDRSHSHQRPPTSVATFLEPGRRSWNSCPSSRPPANSSHRSHSRQWVSEYCYRRFFYPDWWRSILQASSRTVCAVVMTHKALPRRDLCVAMESSRRYQRAALISEIEEARSSPFNLVSTPVSRREAHKKMMRCQSIFIFQSFEYSFRGCVTFRNSVVLFH